MDGYCGCQSACKEKHYEEKLSSASYPSDYLEEMSMAAYNITDANFFKLVYIYP